MRYRACIRLLSCGLALALTLSSTFADDDVETFNTEYLAYAGLMKESEYESALPHARRAYDIGQQLFTGDHDTLSKLAFNLGTVLLKSDDKPGARVVFLQALAHFEQVFDDEAMALVPTLRGLGETTPGWPYADEKIGYYRRAQEIMREHGDTASVAYAAMLTKAAEDVLKFTAASETETFLHDAYDANVDLLGGEHYTTGRSALMLGTYYFSRRDYENAETYLTISLNAIVGTFARPALEEFAINAMLSRICLETGRWRESRKFRRDGRKVEPIQATGDPSFFHAPYPDYPAEALNAGIEGHVRVRFFADRDGLIDDIEVIELEGPESFADAAIAATKQNVVWPGEENWERNVRVEVEGNYSFTINKQSATTDAQNASVHAE